MMLSAPKVVMEERTVHVTADGRAGFFIVTLTRYPPAEQWHISLIKDTEMMPGMPLSGWSRVEEDSKAFGEIRQALYVAGMLRKSGTTTSELVDACEQLCNRLEVAELVNRPGNPCNHYDQPTYDRAKAIIARAKGGGA